MNPKLFCTRSLPGNSLEELRKYYEVEVWAEYPPPPYEVIKEKAKECEAMITLLTDRIDKGVLEGSRLRIIAQYAVGYNNIDVEVATSLGIYVTNTPGVLTEAVAELTWAMILGVARRILEADSFVRSGEWYKTKTGWHPEMMLGTELKGKTLGIVGMGRIGKAVAEKAKAFGMRVLYYSRRKIPLNEERRLGAKYVSLEKVFEEADFISLHVPLTKETYHLVNWDLLCKMKPTAFLINTSRGAVIDENALIKALKEGKIAGAALDVFEEEPLPPKSELTSMKNVLLLPHIGSATKETRIKMAEVVAENLIKFYKGEIPPNLVNPEVVKVRKPGFGGK